MTTPITAIPGIGKVTEKILNESGYRDLRDIVNASIDELSEVHGFGPVRARQIISLAQKIVETDEAAQPDTATDDSPLRDTHKKKDKKKKGKKKDKKKDKKGKSGEKKEKKGKKDKTKKGSKKK